MRRQLLNPHVFWLVVGCCLVVVGCFVFLRFTTAVLRMLLVLSRQLAEGQYGLTIDAGDIAEGYTVPGQYVQIRVGPDAKAGFFAIASAPDKRCVVYVGVCVLLNLPRHGGAGSVVRAETTALYNCFFLRYVVAA